MVFSVGAGVWSLGCRVCGLGFRVQGLGWQVRRLGVGFSFGDKFRGLGCGVLCLRMVIRG